MEVKSSISFVANENLDCPIDDFCYKAENSYGMNAKVVLIYVQ